MTQANLKSASVPVLLEALVLVGELCAELQAQCADALPDPLRIVVPHRGRAELGRDDGEQVALA